MAKKIKRRKGAKRRVFKPRLRVLSLNKTRVKSFWSRKPNTRESAIEDECRDIARASGALLLKWVSPGLKGVPDRILIGKGWVVFIEFKTKTGVLSTHQHDVLTKLVELGHPTHVIRSVVEFTTLLETLQKAGRRVRPKS